MPHHKRHRGVGGIGPAHGGDEVTSVRGPLEPQVAQAAFRAAVAMDMKLGGTAILKLGICEVVKGLMRIGWEQLGQLGEVAYCKSTRLMHTVLTCFSVQARGERFVLCQFLSARNDVKVHLERITQVVLGQERLSRTILIEAISPVLDGYWPHERVVRFCEICWAAAFKAALRGQVKKPDLEKEHKEELVQKAREVLAEHHASELLKEEEKQVQTVEAPAPCPPKAAEEEGVVADKEEAPSEASSESSADLKIRDRSNQFSVFQEVKESDEPQDLSKESLAVRRARDRCKWTVKSYKDGLETTWDVLESDGHLRSMRIVGKEPVEFSRSSPRLAPKAGSDKDGRAKSGLSTLSYSETAEEEHSISMMRTVSSGTVQTVQRLVDELEDEKRWEMNLEGLEEGLCEAPNGQEPAASDAHVPPFHTPTLGWELPMTTSISMTPSLPPRPRVQSQHGSIGRTPSAPSRLEQPATSGIAPVPEHWPPKRSRFNSQECFLARQISLDSERCSVTTPPGLFPSTPECEPSPSGGFMLPPLQVLPSSLDQRQVVYVPVFMPHRCRNCGHECQPEEPPRAARLQEDKLAGDTCTNQRQ